MTPLPLFELRQVGFFYEIGRPAVQEVSFSVAARERLAILGANGSGKSTLLKILDGLILPQTGDLFYRGERLTEKALKDSAFNRAFRSQVGLVFQNPDVQLFCPTVWDEVAFGPLQLGFPPEDVERRAADALALLRLGALRDRPPYRLSGGEKKRVAIAAVLATNPEVLLLDEPTLALDPRSRWELVDILLELANAGKTLITATNDLEIVESIADRAVILGEHRAVLKAGPVASLLADADLLQQANLIHIHAHRHDHGPEHRHPHTRPDHASQAPVEKASGAAPPSPEVK